MKQIYFLFIALCFLNNVNAQYTAIPDANFEAELIAYGYDSAPIDHKVLTANINSITSLNVHNGNISDLTGIQDFVALKRLDCSSNQLTSLNLSKLALTYLNCGVNQLTSLNLSGFSVLTYLDCGRNQLTSLNLSGCTTLKDMFCIGNPLLLCIQVDNKAAALNNNYWKDEIATYSVNCAHITAIPDENFEAVLIAKGYDSGPIDHKVFTTNINEITNLDVSGKIIFNLSGIQDFVALQTLYCNNNQLTNLNISGLTSLKQLNCEANHLTSLNVSGLTALTDLSCSANQLTSLDVSGLTTLKTLNCSSNQLSSINLSGLSALKTLNCSTNQLSSINLSGLSALTELNCSTNQLSSISMSGLSAITLLNCSTNHLSSINLNGLIGLTTLSCGNNQLTSLDMSGLLSLKNLSCNSNQLTNLKLRELTTLATLNCTSNQTLSCIVVENIAVAIANTNWYKDTTATYSLNCDPLYTTIPDVRFEQGLIDLGYDSGSLDHRVLTANINTITSLDLSYGSGIVIYDLTGIQDFVALQRLVINYSQLTAIDVSGLKALTYLNCQSNQLTSLNVSGCEALTTLDCSSNKISSFNLIGATALIDLKCQGNQLTSLNVSDCKALTTLNCFYNQLTSLNVNGLSALNNLNCDGNQLKSLDVNDCTALTDLICPNNQITSLYVSGLKSLTTLNCSYNQLTSLNVGGCKALKTLDCGLNQISSLNVSDCVALNILNCSSNPLPSINLDGLTGLTTVSCGNNQLTSLDLSGLTDLIYLNCSGNQLKSLNVSECKYLIYLYCDRNQLASLNVSDLTNLKTLLCNNNQLTSLNVNGLIALSTFQFGSNQLTSLYIKNGKKDAFSLLGNPNLKYICVDEVENLKVQNDLARYGYTNCNVNTYCSFVPGGTFYTIRGNQKLDSNANGCDALDEIFPNLKFTISDGTVTGGFISNSTGNYSIPVQQGTHAISPVIENPTYFNVSPTTVNVTFPTQTSPFIQDFCISANGVHPDLEITLLPLRPAVPGFDAIYKIIYKNKGNTTQSGSVKLAFNDSVLDLVVANPITTTQSTNNLSWDFINLLPFETREITFTLNVNSPMETPAVNSGSILPYFATITSAATDETPIDNTFAFNQTVVNSFDPNDKTCLEGTTVSPSLISQYVHYMIRFENNGTANAKNIVVKDMIDLSKFDISTLIPTNASHSFVTNITAGNKVEFIFENINLPFDDANNDGYIAFKIKTLPTLKVGDTFTNDASIYFDYNFPVVTKPASSTFKTLGTTDFEFSNYFTLYPNPVKSVLNISSKETIEVKSISIYNTLGQLVLVVPNAEKMSKIDISSLTSGNYFIKINSDKGSSNARFIKE